MFVSIDLSVMGIDFQVQKSENIYWNHMMKIIPVYDFYPFITGDSRQRGLPFEASLLQGVGLDWVIQKQSTNPGR
jgi:hypothetical protein